MPASTSALVQSMASAWNAGDAERVIELAAQSSGIGIDDENVLALLGLAQQHVGRHSDAVKTFERLVRIRPEVSAYWNNLGVACRQTGNLAASEPALVRAKLLAPHDAEVLYNLGLLYIQQRHWPLARQALLDAVKLSPQFVEARLQAGYACHVCGDSHGEDAMLEGAGGWPPQPAAQALILAMLLSTQGNLEASLQALARARLPEEPAAEPMRLRIAAQRALLHERSNQVARARRELEQLPLNVLDALPADADEVRIDGWRAHAAVAMRDRRHADAAELYRSALDAAVDDESLASAAFGLAAARDRQARHADAWQALEAAHAAQLAIVREVAPELLAPDSQPLPMAARSVDAPDYARWRPLAALGVRQSPVFVIGFPRSGTTLLEQMLDAHPDFRSMDERGYIYELIERMEGGGQRYPGDLANLTQTDAEQLRDLYCQMVRHVLPDLGQRRLVDKNPLNMLCLPMILRLFPEACIILCLRHPCDVLLSCCMQAFRSPAFMVMSSSLERLARSYAQAFEQCCGHLAVFTPRVLEWRYESAVCELDDSLTRLAHFLDVKDVSPMAGFDTHARSKSFIGTPSYAKVTEPVNRAAVGRWTAYREHFEPVLPILHPWIKRFGYSL